MDKRCQICGDIGFVDALIICHVCKSSREHAYCMPNFKGEVPRVWTCEACEKGKTKLGVVSSSANFSQSRGKWEKKVKTKYISVNEVIKLSSGTTFNLPRDKLAPTPTRPPLKANPIPQKFSPPRSKSNHAAGSSSYLKLQTQTSQPSKGQAEASKEVKRPAQTLELLRGFVHPQKNVYTNVEPPLKSISKRVEDIETANREVQKEVGKLPRSSSDDDSVNEKDSDFVAEKRIPMNISPQVFPSDPALHPSWKGNFKIIRSCTLSDLLHNEIQAHPRLRVPRKVYEFSKKMPQVLEFKLLPRQPIWSDLYQNRFHDNDKIGLYFFPSDPDRNEKFIDLVNLISAGDFVMRNYINGVELLVFASGCLPVDSRKWNGDEFLWGVFRPVKETDVKVEAALLPLCPPSIGESEDADMEIDMVGGTQVGKVDVIISRRQPPNTISPAVSRTSSSAGNEMSNLAPPGFENNNLVFRSPEVYGGSTSAVKQVKYSDSPSQIGNPEVMGRNSALHVKVETEVL